MLTLEKDTTQLDNINYDSDNPLVPESQEICRYYNKTLLCGKIIEVDYVSRIQDKMSYEPFYGDIDLFGF